MPLEISSQEKLKALLFSSDPKNQVLALHKEDLLACTARYSFYDTAAFEQFLEE